MTGSPGVHSVEDRKSTVTGQSSKDIVDSVTKQKKKRKRPPRKNKSKDLGKPDKQTILGIKAPKASVEGNKATGQSSEGATGSVTKKKRKRKPRKNKFKDLEKTDKDSGKQATSIDKTSQEVSKTNVMGQSSEDVTGSVTKTKKKRKRKPSKSGNSDNKTTATSDKTCLEGSKTTATGQSSEDVAGSVTKKKKRKRKPRKNKFKDLEKPVSKSDADVKSDESVAQKSTETEKPGSESSSVKKKRKRKKKPADTDKLNKTSTESTSEPSLHTQTSSVQQEKMKKKKANLNETENNKENDDSVSESKENLIQKKQSKGENNENLKSKKKMVKDEDQNLKSKSTQVNSSENTGTPKFKAKSPSSHAGFDPQKLALMLSNERRKSAKNDADLSSDNEDQNTTTQTSDRVSGQQSLKEKMEDKLKAARFRYLNQQLYTQTGSEAFQMFKKDKDSFHVYHKGFQGQVEKWPVNPVDLIIKYIKSRQKDFVIADFGCGDAKIAQAVANKVHSFDLAAVNKHVTVCDMAKVPLKDNSIDIAVFCLSLMGTNLADYIREANRVLKKGGKLKIAEVTSRFHSIGAFVGKVESLGFKFLHQEDSSKMFVLLEFKKVKAAEKKNVNIKLDPCLYKKR